MVGISAIIILLKAFASGGSAPIRSKIISSSLRTFTSMSTLLIKCFKLLGSSYFVTAEKLAGCSKV
jgi:hypothetical protein